jgi:hypothetical protein
MSAVRSTDETVKWGGSPRESIESEKRARGNLEGQVKKRALGRHVLENKWAWF